MEEEVRIQTHFVVRSNYLSDTIDILAGGREGLTSSLSITAPTLYPHLWLDGRMDGRRNANANL
jgi:hypothetical protein